LLFKGRRRVSPNVTVNGFAASADVCATASAAARRRAKRKPSAVQRSSASYESFRPDA